ncbi:MAG: hypothetical protein IAE78_01180 [Myxococcus sp.]|nr:hypothetical protein [Myxococcus sp.]
MTDSAVDPSSELSPAHRKARADGFREFMVALQRAGESSRTYAADHPSVAQAVERLEQRLGQVLTQFGEIEFEVTGECIVFDGNPVVSRAGGRDFLARTLFQEGVRKVTIQPGAPVEEVRTLITAFTRSTGEEQPGQESLASRFWEADFKFIRLVILDTLDLGAQDDGGEVGDKVGRSAGWQATFQSDVDALVNLMQHEHQPSTMVEAGAIAVTAEALDLLNSEGLRDITADDLARHDVSQQVLESASEDARVGLREGVMTEVLQGADRYWAALLNAAVTMPAQQQACLEASNRLALTMAAEGQFVQAIDVFQQLVTDARDDSVMGPQRVAMLTEFKKGLVAPEVLDRLVAGLDDPAQAVACEAGLKRIVRSVAPQVQERFVTLKTDEGRARLKAVLSSTAAARPALAVPVAKLDDKGVATALEALETLAPADAAELVARALGSADTRVRRLAAQKLDASIAMVMPKGSLHRRLSDADPVVRRKAMALVGEMEDASAVPHLKGVLQRALPDEERLIVYEALGSIHHPHAQVLLVEELDARKEVPLRVACIEAISHYASPLALKTLNGLTGKLLINPTVRRAAADAVARLERGE